MMTIQDSIQMLITKDYSKFYQLVLEQGYPLKYRWSGWKVLLSSKDIYKREFDQLIQFSNDQVTDIVSKDVPRTFSTNPFFKNKIDGIDVGKELLYKVCTAIGSYFTEVGYTQGLNFLAGYMLQVSGGSYISTFS